MAAPSNQNLNLDAPIPRGAPRPTNDDPFSSENRLRSCRFVKEFKRGCQKLMHLKVNVKLAGSRDSWVKNLTDFCVGEGYVMLPLRQEGAYSPLDYSWLSFRVWLENRLGYTPRVHDIISVQFGEAQSFTIDSEKEWLHFLGQVAQGMIRVTPHDYLHLEIRPRGNVEEFSLIGKFEKLPVPVPGQKDPAENKNNGAKESSSNNSNASKGIEILKAFKSYRKSGCSEDPDLNDDPLKFERHPDSDLFVEYTSAYASPYTSPKPSPTSTPETPELPDSGLSASGFDLRSPAVSAATTSVSFEGNSTSLASTPMTPGGFNRLQLVDVPEGEYKVDEEEDEKYGVDDDGSVDTSLRACNTTATSVPWLNFADFCGLRQTSNLDPKGPNRVPVVKFPGMSVGLFDYQLAGVLTLLELTANVSGAILADEQGLGKTQEMFAITALANGLRKNKLDVTNPGPSSRIKHHSDATAPTAKTCPADRSIGFRCYCYHKTTREFADRIPEGPTIIVAPSRSCLQLFREAKTKLDQKTFKLRLHHATADKEDQLSPSDTKELTSSVSAVLQSDGTLRVSRKAKPSQSQYVIVTSPHGLSVLANKTLAVKVKTGDETVSLPGLLPGLVFCDEFHEYIGHGDKENMVTELLRSQILHVTRGLKPLVFFVSGTPLGESPADIRPVIELFERKGWADDKSNPMAAVTTSFLDGVTASYEELLATQTSGLIPDPKKVADYRRRLNQIFKPIMVRRLGTDSFRNRPLTIIGPLRVNIINHELPDSLVPLVQAFADHVAATVTAANSGENVLRLLNGSNGPAILEKLRLVSTFPNLASTFLDESSSTFAFSASEIKEELLSAKHNVRKTRYFAKVPGWAMHSPKLATINATVNRMLSDKTPVPGSGSGHAKKLAIFCPVEAEALLVYAYLLIRKSTTTTTSNSTSTPTSLRHKSILSSMSATLKPTFISSAMTSSQRQEVIDKFLEQGHAPPNVLVAPIALIGTGLNLQRANYSIVTGPAWTKRENQQAYYRIHRVGQTQVTHLQLLTARWNPAERLILARHEGTTAGEEDLWKVGNGFKAGEGSGGLEKHQEEDSA